MTRRPINLDERELHAADMLHLAAWCGVRVWRKGQRLVCDRHASPRLRALLEAYLPGLRLVLSGRACRVCAEPITTVNPVALRLADGTVHCKLCFDDWPLDGEGAAPTLADLGDEVARTC